jgi:hypothetical protein
MAATSVPQAPLGPPGENLEQLFHRLKAQWSADTLVLSDPGKIMAHPTMRAIIALGQGVVPLILRDLQENRSLIVWALPEITGEDPAPPKVEGGFLKWDVRAQIEAGLRWGREKGLV